MQSYQIIAGFSDIKSELRMKTRTSKQMSELRLWFSVTDEILYVHDYELHSCCTAIAIKLEQRWDVRLNPGTFGYKLILEITREIAADNIIKELHRQYNQHGVFI